MQQVAGEEGRFYTEPDLSMSMIGQTIGRYRITHQLGAGGMGIVYGAHDTMLGHRVWKLASALLLAGVVSAQVPSVCLEDRVGMNSFAMRAFEGEIRKLAPELALAAGTCAGPAISVVISAHAPASYANALGLARIEVISTIPLLFPECNGLNS